MIAFKTTAERDAFAAKLHDLWSFMLRSGDQGHDGKIYVTTDMVDDLIVAEAIVRTAPVCDGQQKE